MCRSDVSVISFRMSFFNHSFYLIAKDVNISLPMRDSFSSQMTVELFDCVSCSKTFLRARNNPVVLKNSTEHAEPLLIVLLFLEY